MTTIRSVGIQGKAGQFIFDNHPDTQKHSHPTITALQHKNVAATKWMQGTRPPVVVWQEADNNNAALGRRERGEREHHRFCGGVMFVFFCTYKQ
jgi:hypothetical protein